MPDNEFAGAPETQEVIATLQHSFEESLDKQKALWEQVSRVTKDKSIRFTKQRLDKTSKALDSLKGAGPQSIITGQQQWLQDLVKDYTDQSLRYTEMLRGLAMNAFTSALSSGHKAAQSGQDVVRAGATEVEETADTIRDSAEAIQHEASETVFGTADALNNAEH